MLRVSCLLAAAITSHCISLFYGHKQLWNSLSPFGASLETSASVLFTTSEPGRFPTVGGVCIVNMLWFIHIESWISRKRTHCVVAVFMCVCTAYLCPFSLHFFYDRTIWPQQHFVLFSPYMEDISNFGPCFIPVLWFQWPRLQESDLENLTRHSILSGGALCFFLFYCLSMSYN